MGKRFERETEFEREIESYWERERDQVWDWDRDIETENPYIDWIGDGVLMKVMDFWHCDVLGCTS